jgi:hypothetical protein
MTRQTIRWTKEVAVIRLIAALMFAAVTMGPSVSPQALKTTS